MRTVNELIKDYLRDAFEALDLSDYGDYFEEQELETLKDDAMSEAEEMFLTYMLPDSMDPDDEVTEDFEKYISITAIEVFAEKSADMFIMQLDERVELEEMLEPMEAEEAEQ